MPERVRNDRDFKKLLAVVGKHARDEAYRAICITIDMMASYLVMPTASGFDIQPLKRADDAGWTLPDLVDSEEGDRSRANLGSEDPVIEAAARYLVSSGVGSVAITPYSQKSHVVLRGPNDEVCYSELDLDVPWDQSAH